MALRRDQEDPPFPAETHGYGSRPNLTTFPLSRRKVSICKKWTELTLESAGERQGEFSQQENWGGRKVAILVVGQSYTLLAGTMSRRPGCYEKEFACGLLAGGVRRSYVGEPAWDERF